MRKTDVTTVFIWDFLYKQSFSGSLQHLRLASSTLCFVCTWVKGSSLGTLNLKWVIAIWPTKTIMRSSRCYLSYLCSWFQNTTRSTNRYGHIQGFAYHGRYAPVKTSCVTVCLFDWYTLKHSIIKAGLMGMSAHQQSAQSLKNVNVKKQGFFVFQKKSRSRKWKKLNLIILLTGRVV